MHGRISGPAMGPYPPRVAQALCPSPNHSAIGQRRWDFHTVRGGVYPGENRFHLRGVGVEEIRRDLRSGHGALSFPGGAGSTRSSQSAIGQRDWGFHIMRGGRVCSDTEGSLNRGRGPIVPGLISLYAPQPISDRPVGLRFSYRTGRYRPGRTRFSSPGCRICRYKKGCLNRGWGPILPGCGGTWRGGCPGQSAIGPWDWGFHTVWGGVDPV